jgi:hypothetical protein
LPQQTSSASPAAKRETPLHGLQKSVVDGDAAGYLLMQDGTDRVVAKALQPSKAVSGILHDLSRNSRSADQCSPMNILTRFLFITVAGK